MKEQILQNLPAACPWRDTLHWVDRTDSTSTLARQLAQAGAPEGTAVAAGMQTGGRGRMGRSFSSPAGMGMYLSVILRPDCTPSELMHLTCAAAVAACQAVESASGLQPGIKWTNDLVLGSRKLGGILTELSLHPKNGHVEWAIIGIGVNCLQAAEDFPPALRDMATSLAICGKAIPPAILTAAMLHALENMRRCLFTEKDRLLDVYRTRCITLGKQIRLVQGDRSLYATAVGIDAEGGLEVIREDGSPMTVSSGEVSVRGMYGYI